MPKKQPTPEELADRLRELSVALRRRVRAEPVADGAVPFPQLAVLKRLEMDGPATTADLARAEGMTPQSMGAIVAALEEGGHLTRRDDASHGRRRLASLTAAGRKALAASRALRLSWTASVLAERLDATERRTVAAALALLHRAFLS